MRKFEWNSLLNCYSSFGKQGHTETRHRDKLSLNHEEFREIMKLNVEMINPSLNFKFWPASVEDDTANKIPSLGYSHFFAFLLLSVYLFGFCPVLPTSCLQLCEKTGYNKWKWDLINNFAGKITGPAYTYCWVLHCFYLGGGNAEKLLVSQPKPLLLAIRIYCWREFMLIDSQYRVHTAKFGSCSERKIISRQQNILHCSPQTQKNQLNNK